MSPRIKIWTVCVITVAGLIAAVCFAQFNSFHGLAFPRNTFLADPSVRFTDFTDVLTPTRARDPFASYLCDYPPFMYVPLLLLSPLPNTQAYAVFAIACLAATIGFLFLRLPMLRPHERIAATLVLSLCTYPVIVALDRGNTDLFVLAMTVLFFEAYLRARPLYAAVYLGLAAACKVYPFAYVVLFIANRQYRAAAVTGAVAVAANLASLFIYAGGPVASLRQWGDNLSKFNRIYVYNHEGLHFDVSYFAQIKIIAFLLGHDNENTLKYVTPPYNLFCAAVLLFIAVYIVRVERRLWKQVALLSFATILLPEISFDYKLIFLLPPVTLFLADPKPRADDRVYSILFGLMLIPKAYYWLRNTTTSIEAPLNVLLMTVCGTLIIRTGVVSQRRR